MHLTITTHRHTEHVEKYSLSFSRISGIWKGSGYGFECTPDGQITQIGPFARYSLASAISGYLDGEMSMRVENYSYDYRVSAEGICHCGEPVSLDDPLWNACANDHYYDASGNRILPPSMCEDVWDDDDPDRYNPYPNYGRAAFGDAHGDY